MKTATLSEIVDSWGGLIQTGPFGSQLHQHDYSEQGIPVVMPKDIRNGRVDESGIARIPEAKANQLSRHFLKPGSVVFPRRGEIGKCAYINDDQAGFLCGTGCIKIEPPEEKLRSKFLFYFLGLRQSVEWLKRNAVGTTMLNLNTKILGGLKIPLIPPKEQDEVIEILSAYDDLIENNRRRIALLEQAARLLYKEWFVHLRFPGHEHTKIINGVPEGWEKKHLSQVFNTQYGFTESATNDPIGPKFLRGMDINKTSYIDWSTVPYCSDEKLEFQKYKLEVDDILVIRMADPGKVAIIETEEKAVFASYLIRLTRKSGIEIPALYLFYVLASEQYQGFISGASGGSTRKSANAKLIVDFDILVPTSSLLQLFTAQIQPMRHQIQTLLQQNANLRHARDLLLPKLMNGEVAV